MELIESLKNQIAENKVHLCFSNPILMSFKCEAKVGDTRVLNVAAQDCREYIKEIIETLEKKEQEDPDTKQVLVHMGN